MTEWYKYNPDFVPILLEGQTITLYGSEISVEGLNCKCIAVGSLPEDINDFGALTAATWDTDNEYTDLEMGTMELAQYRFRVLDDMQCRLKNPSAVQQWRSKSNNFYLPQFPNQGGQDWQKVYLWMASEFFVFQDKGTPRFDFYSPIILVNSRCAFSGWRFKLQKIDTKGKIDLWVNSWPTQSGK